ncbi:MAG TPA: hypothetical protein VGU74_14840 [Gemmatimonadales bacterium]|nr:hypothetical protein [Gemmatimonadales bacterium]
MIASTGMQATMTGMIVLMVPAFLVCTVVAVVAFRKRGNPD